MGWHPGHVGLPLTSCVPTSPSGPHPQGACPGTGDDRDGSEAWRLAEEQESSGAGPASGGGAEVAPDPASPGRSQSPEHSRPGASCCFKCWERLQVSRPERPQTRTVCGMVLK